jgi:hypothetical protein
MNVLTTLTTMTRMKMTMMLVAVIWLILLLVTMVSTISTEYVCCMTRCYIYGYLCRSKDSNKVGYLVVQSGLCVVVEVKAQFCGERSNPAFVHPSSYLSDGPP